VGGGGEYNLVERKDSDMSDVQRMKCSVRGLKTCLLVAVVGSVGALSMPALGQNALGDGRGLAANPRQGSGGQNYQRPSLEKEVQFRNAIATGNAPGGLSFRGDLGYRAPGEFSGALGSDSLYSFRRDSLYSGLAGMGIRGTDAIQYQFSMTTGSRVTRNLVGNLSLSRLDGANSSRFRGGVHDGMPLAIDPVGQLQQQRQEQRQLQQGSGAVSGTLRSASSYSANLGLSPELVSVFEKGIERDRYGLVSTPLMGLVATPLDSAKSRQKAARARGTAGVTEPIRTSYTDTVEELRARAEAIRARRLENQEAGPDDGSDPDAKERETSDWIAQQLMQLQRQVLGIPEPAGEDDPIEVVERPEGASSMDVDGSAKVRDPMNPYPDGEGIKGGVGEMGTPEISFDYGEGLVGNSTYTIDPDTLEMIRGDGRRITYLIDPTASNRDIYSEHISAGERLLAKGRYFDAEERFTNALAIRQGDVSAQLGRLHAQIGAGLVISASVNLQGLMSEHLEVVSRRYAGELLPSEDRLEDLIFNLRVRAGLDERRPGTIEESVQVRVASGLLIAYLGYQLDDAEQMNDGLSVIRRIGSGHDARLVRLLETVWGSVMESDGVSGGRDGSESEP